MKEAYWEKNDRQKMWCIRATKDIVVIDYVYEIDGIRDINTICIPRKLLEIFFGVNKLKETLRLIEEDIYANELTPEELHEIIIKDYKDDGYD